MSKRCQKSGVADRGSAVEMPVELIVGSKRVVPTELREINGRLVAELSGSGLMSVLDATFGGEASVEVWAFGQAPKPMWVVEIAMNGGNTVVTFEDAGRKISIN